jgi:hypothetical protein
MGFELGPKLLRGAPKGWLPARAFPESHSASSHNYGSEGPGEIETSLSLTVTWRVEIAGRGPYELQEQRSGPMWLSSGGVVGTGNRWYKVRVRPRYGLMQDVGVPCVVNPSDPSEILIDWDRAYDEHVPRWEREARVRREVTRRGGGIDAVLGKISNPLIGKLRPEDEPYVQAAMERQARREREFQPVKNPVLEAAGVEIKRRMDGLERISREGRKVSAVVVDRVESGRKLGTMPVIDLVFELEGRHVPFEHVFGPRHAKRYTVGARVDVWVDRDDPTAICPGR